MNGGFQKLKNQNSSPCMSKPRILIAASIYPPDPGGPALHANKQYEYYLKERFPVRVVALAHFRSLPIGIRHVFFAVVLFSHACTSDVIYAHDALGVGLPALFVARILNKKLIIRVGGDIVWERKSEQGETLLSMNEWYKTGSHKKEFNYVVSRFVLSRIDCLIVPSNLLSDLYTKYYDVSQQRIQVIANPMISQKEILPHSIPRTIIFASRLVAYKNLSFVIECMSRVLPKYNDTQFLIMGDGPEKLALKKQVNDLKMSKQIIFTGILSQEEVEKHIRSCIFTIAPALTEFNPNYVLQGIQWGKPFLVSREHGFPFVVPQEFLFNSRNKEECEQCIAWMLSDPGYADAVLKLKSLSITQTWEDVLMRNKEIIELVCK